VALVVVAVLGSLLTPSSASAASLPPQSCTARLLAGGSFEVRWVEASAPMARYIIYRSNSVGVVNWRAAVNIGDSAYSYRVFTDGPTNTTLILEYTMRAKELTTSSVSGPVSCSWVQGPSTGVTGQPLTAVEIAAGNYVDGQGAVDLSWVQAPTSLGTLVIGERRAEATDTSIEETRVVTVTDPGFFGCGTPVPSLGTSTQMPPATTLSLVKTGRGRGFRARRIPAVSTLVPVL